MKRPGATTLKARLQSLLVRRYGDDHVVVKPAEQEGVVSLVHRSGVKDACHADAGGARSSTPARGSGIASTSRASPAIPVDGVRPSGVRPAEDRPSGFRPADRDPSGDRRADEEEVASVRGAPRPRPPFAVHEFDYEAAEHRLRLALEQQPRRRRGRRWSCSSSWSACWGWTPRRSRSSPRLSPAAAAHPGVRTLARPGGGALRRDRARSARWSRARSCPKHRRGLRRPGGGGDPPPGSGSGRPLSRERRAPRPDPAADSGPHGGRSPSSAASFSARSKRRSNGAFAGGRFRWRSRTRPARCSLDGPRARSRAASCADVAAHRSGSRDRRSTSKLAEGAWEAERFRDAAHHYQAALGGGE